MPLEKDLTKEEWGKVKAIFNTLFGDITLTCDGHEIHLRRCHVKNRFTTMVYVDGFYKGAWTKNDPEFKFLRPIKRPLYSRHKLESRFNSKRLSKVERQAISELLKEKFTFYVPFWPSFAPLRIHLRKVCSSIELVQKKSPGLDELPDV
jgi:hypothetical protein